MKNTVRMYCYFLCMFLILKCNGNPNLPMNTIQIPSNRMNNNFIRSERYHVKQQLPNSFAIQGPSETYVKVPGLTIPFHHTEPLLYKIKFEGKCYSPQFSSIWLYLRFMINDNLLYVDKFLPNTANRYQLIAGYSWNDAIDYIGAVRSGVGGGALPTYVHGGALTIELVENDLNADIGIPRVNATFIAPSIG
ncbi:unnamed protein product [Adineta steineri]|uniref:Uncharacterized protein n=1 Tax=Adineta steineri TaxID=433720 RepID=A0A819XFX7_9BILA|nr:unnamed protein product [Adineta steineri]CAF4140442.1 unnamed protein product [Adineta steineri]